MTLTIMITFKRQTLKEQKQSYLTSKLEGEEENKKTKLIVLKRRAKKKI